MQFRFRSLFLWFLFYYFIIEGVLHNLIVKGEYEPISIFDTAFSLTSLLSFFLYWLICYFVFHKFYPDRKWLFILGGLVLSFFVPVFCRYLVEQVLFLHVFDMTNYPVNVKLKNYVIDQYLFGSRYIPAGIIYYFIESSFFNQKKEKELTIENQKMKLSLLLAQINPHFLLNSLNNIQSLVYLKSDKAILAIENLSDLLKYNLYQNEKWVAVEEEAALMKKYIALERIRYDYEFDMNIDIDDEVKHKKIPQHTLFPILENAFKHANLKSKSTPFSLTVNETKKGIQIHSSNEIGHQAKDKLGGIGLENLRKRLHLLYEEETTFRIEQKDQVFFIEISLPRL